MVDCYDERVFSVTEGEMLRKSLSVCQLRRLTELKEDTIEYRLLGESADIDVESDAFPVFPLL